MKELNLFEKIVMNAMVHYLSQVRQVDFVRFKEGWMKEGFGRDEVIGGEGDCVKDFRKFVDERQYTYTVIPAIHPANIIAPYQML